MLTSEQTGAAGSEQAGLLAPGVPVCELRDLGRCPYADAWALQQQLVEQRKRGEVSDQLLFVEHPHVITMGRNGHLDNLLASEDVLERTGISFHHTNRGGDVTYHGPGQLVGYPIVDLKEWRRDVMAYVRALEQVLINTLGEFNIQGERDPGATGVWVSGSKVAAIGVHISRWVTCHGFALNIDTDLQYFQYIVPCGLARPVTSLAQLGIAASRAQVMERVSRQFGRAFGRRMEQKSSFQNGEGVHG